MLISSGMILNSQCIFSFISTLFEHSNTKMLDRPHAIMWHVCVTVS